MVCCRMICNRDHIREWEKFEINVGLPYLNCSQGQTLSENGMCVPKPWHNYVDCATERGKGACHDNDWVKEHCPRTCSM